MYCYNVGTRVPKRLTEVVKVIDLARANNVSIMLTQFHAFKAGAPEVRHAVLTGSKLGLERLSLLLQVCPAAVLHKLHLSGNSNNNNNNTKVFFQLMMSYMRVGQVLSLHCNLF